MKHTISVIMSVYNEKLIWIREAIESIIRQTFMDFEFIIIIDNPNLCVEIKRYIYDISNSDDRVRVIENQHNLGLPGALNRGIKEVSSMYIARMDADDISKDNRFELELNYLNNNNVDMVSSNKENIDEQGKLISVDSPINRDPNKTLQYGNIIIHSSIIVKTSVLKELGGYRDLINSEDYDLWLRLLDRGYTIGIVDEPLIQYRIRSNSASVERGLQQFYATEYVLKLKKQRERNDGKDNYSLENMKEYIARRDSTNIKRKRFSMAKSNMEKALSEMNENKTVRALALFAKAAILFPALILKSISNMLHRKFS